MARYSRSSPIIVHSYFLFLTAGSSFQLPCLLFRCRAYTTIAADRELSAFRYFHSRRRADCHRFTIVSQVSRRQVFHRLIRYSREGTFIARHIYFRAASDFFLCFVADMAHLSAQRTATPPAFRAGADDSPTPFIGFSRARNMSAERERVERLCRPGMMILSLATSRHYRFTSPAPIDDIAHVAADGVGKFNRQTLPPANAMPVLMKPLSAIFRYAVNTSRRWIIG